jgi:hypothetical protein
MKNFGTSFNPLSHIPGMIRGFGRAATTPAETPASVIQPFTTVTATADGSADVSAALSKIDPPVKRFLETEDPGDLKLRDVSELLQDYKRLAAALAGLSKSS